MKQDTHKTIVRFYIEPNANGQAFSYFPKDNGEFKGCYSHIGQHSACHPDYLKQCRKATPEQYAPLKTELENIGYNLTVK
jgi:hypothetical protein